MVLNIGGPHTTHEINFTAPKDYGHTSYTFCHRPCCILSLEASIWQEQFLKYVPVILVLSDIQQLTKEMFSEIINGIPCTFSRSKVVTRFGRMTCETNRRGD